MLIPLTIDQLSTFEESRSDSTEVVDWFKQNGFLKVLELSKFLKFSFREESLNRQLLRSWMVRDS